MQIERMTVTLRPRSDWEAVDLGLRMAQRHAGIAWPVWALASAPWMLVLSFVAIGVGHAILAALAFWWLKPLFERPLLHVFSRVVFGDDPARPQWPGIAYRTPFSAGWLGAITWRRFELSRSFNLPVWQLERLRGSARRQRSGVLHLDTGSTAFALTLMCACLVALATITLTLVLVSLTIQEIVIFDFRAVVEFIDAVVERLDREGIAWDIFFLSIYWFCEGLMAPFFVAAGFSLYLNRRTHLEAWDVELAFRRMRARRNTGTAAVFLAALSLTVFTPEHAQAQATDDIREERRSQIEQIIENSDFGRTQTRTRWVPKNKKAPELDDDTLRPETASFLSRLVAVISEVIVWVVVCAVLVFIYRSRRHWLGYFQAGSRQRVTPNAGAGGLLLSEEELPADVPASVRALWANGERREALSLLYRGALTVLNDAHELRISDSDTEGDCERRVLRRLDATPAGYFARVANTWQRLAYGHQTPDTNQVDALCDEWHLIEARAQ